MSYIGRWKFQSIGVINDADEMEYLDAQAYLVSPMPYIDETDEEAVADEMRERRQMVGMQIQVCEDGNLYVLMPLPEGVSQAELDAVVAAGRIRIYDGMMTDGPLAWEERDGQLWLDMGLDGNEMVKVSDGDGIITLMTTRYVKLDGGTK